MQKLFMDILKKHLEKDVNELRLEEIARDMTLAMTGTGPTGAFIQLMIAAMADAASGTMTQLQCTFGPKQTIIRVIMVPEKMDYKFSPALGTLPPKGN